MARSFNGSTDEVVLPSGLDLGIQPNGQNPFSISAWVNLSNSAVTSNAYAIINGESNGALELRIGNGSSFVLQLLSAHTSALINSTGAITKGSWTQVGLTSGSGATAPYVFYIGGAASGSGTYNPNAILTGKVPYALGNGFGAVGGDAFLGNLADIGSWNVVLTAGEMSGLANGARPFQIRPKSFIGYWPLDGLQSPEIDFSGGANNGSLAGTAFVAGPPIMLFTPRQPANAGIVVAGSSFKFRRTLSSVGTRMGSRQAMVV